MANKTSYMVYKVYVELNKTYIILDILFRM